ncbi:MAG: LysR family transcriptional regulator [Burkholderiaceae bacterium]
MGIHTVNDMRTSFRQLDLNLLRVLAALDRCRSVTEAGRLLSLSQPAASNALARLREAFDDPLFVRGADGLVPTALATRIGPLAARHLESLEAALAGPERFDPATSTTCWRLSLSDLGEVVFLPAITDTVLAQAPHTRFANAAVPADRLADALAAGEVDLAIGILDPRGRGIRSTLLFRERYVALGRRDLPAELRTRSGFARASFVLASPTATYHEAIAETLERRGLSDRIAVRAKHYAAVPDLVNRAPLVAIVPRVFGAAACERLPLAMWPVPLKMPTFEIRMVWHSVTDRDSAQGWLRDRVRRLFRLGRAAPAPLSL